MKFAPLTPCLAKCGTKCDDSNGGYCAKCFRGLARSTRDRIEREELLVTKQLRTNQKSKISRGHSSSRKDRDGHPARTGQSAPQETPGDGGVTGPNTSHKNERQVTQ